MESYKIAVGSFVYSQWVVIGRPLVLPRLFFSFFRPIFIGLWWHWFSFTGKGGGGGGGQDNWNNWNKRGEKKQLSTNRWEGQLKRPDQTSDCLYPPRQKKRVFHNIRREMIRKEKKELGKSFPSSLLSCFFPPFYKKMTSKENKWNLPSPGQQQQQQPHCDWGTGDNQTIDNRWKTPRYYIYIWVCAQARAFALSLSKKKKKSEK